MPQHVYEVGDLAKFMEHDDKFHNDHYRQSVLERDLVNVAKLFEKAQGIYEGSDPRNVIDEAEKDDPLRLETTPIQSILEENSGLDETFYSSMDISTHIFAREIRYILVFRPTPSYFMSAMNLKTSMVIMKGDTTVHLILNILKIHV